MLRAALFVASFLLCALLVGAQAAVFESYTFASDANHQRYRQWVEQLRCLVCQNQNIAESNAELAFDLRRQTRSMIEDGYSDAQIETYMVERYGDFVLYSPPLRGATMALWWGPLAFVIMGLGLLALHLRRRRSGA